MYTPGGKDPWGCKLKKGKIKMSDGHRFGIIIVTVVLLLLLLLKMTDWTGCKLQTARTWRAFKARPEIMV